MNSVASSLFRSAMLGLLTLVSVAGAVGTPAGTVIRNQASAVFGTPDLPDAQNADSNTVSTTVQAVCSVSVTPDGTPAQPARSATLLPGERAVFPYAVVNTGNATQTLPVQVTLDASSTISPTARVFLDANGNGQLDAAETEVSSVTLDADAQAPLLLVVDTGNAQGDAYVNVVAGCAGGMQDANNVSRVRVGPPPVLGVTKTFTPAVVRPGRETTVTLTVTNSGQGGSRSVLLTDALDAQAAQGLTFVPGSAQASAGTLEYTSDGTTWSATETPPVRGVRVGVPSLAPDDTVTVTFRMLAGAAAENHVIQNIATAESGGATVSASASADVRYSPDVALGPVGMPQAPEGSAADSQGVPFAVAGQAVCFDHTLLNTGDVRDDFTLAVTYPQGAATATLLTAAGTPLPQPVTLDPGQSTVVRVCYDAQRGPLDAVVTAKGTRGESNTTHDTVAAVETGLPELTKAYTATTTAADGQRVAVPAGNTVAVGDHVTYTLTVRNPYTHPLSDAVVSDPVPAHVDVVSASAGGVTSGQPGAQTVTWTLGTLAPGETRTLEIATTVSARAVDGEALRNTFTLTTREVARPLPSNEVSTPVWSAQLQITKTVSAKEATFGDLLTYTLTITNTSATTAIVDADVTDTPARGLAYVPGSSVLNGQPVGDPAITNGALHWTLASLPAGQAVTLAYQTRVTPEAAGDLVNSVVVSGTGAGGVARAVASNRATAVIKLRALLFAPVADIVGVVYVDRNRDGRFDPGLDTPVPRARVLLAGGRQALTDDHGRYSFPNVPQGAQALRLDPGTTPYPPLRLPQDGGLSGTRSVQLRGLTSVDFPLAPLGGDIDVLRSTTLLIGDVTLDKTVAMVPDGYVVTLRVSTPRTLEDVQLTDALPDGATLKDGRNTYIGTLQSGEFTLTYRFSWAGEPRAATTDPVLSWRY
ncbi:putative repeat protein (TIGR01451 family) [Deinococcus metalli]|uniref:Putative repeat protein (TIGR01451 family) n=1 Tax=Deinococcus metalli TaxID=1141878 RepID=A0A7W8KG68_9DEIO|nr:DUF11 domain-containing protein [Deinococcus metalli]MBB5377622.1 putative repeat protein (TIGR01451 family) [Deinococcus metalli]GHF52118.1 hypothetical protein GCM10017781_30490 [Deinococcus metalli]